jgi:hypothetical protein
VILAGLISAAITFVVHRRFFLSDEQGIFKTFAVFVFAWGVIGVTFRILGLSLLRAG